MSIGPRTIRIRRLLWALFTAYLVALVWIIVWKLAVPWIGEDSWRTIKLVPFVSFGESGSSAPREVWANLLLFIPFGVYLALLRPRWGWLRVLLGGALSSAVLEASQWVLAVGSSDLTDVIMNSAGGIVGFALVRIVRALSQSATTEAFAHACLVGTAVLGIACAAYAISPFRYVPLHDVHIDTQNTAVDETVAEIH